MRECSERFWVFFPQRETSVFVTDQSQWHWTKISASHSAATSVDQLIALIADGDAKGLSKLPKVGKKTSEQIILTLKGKLVFADEPKNEMGKKFSTRDDIVSALVNLGFRLYDVEKVVEKMNPQVNLESGVREGLLALTT